MTLREKYAILSSLSLLTSKFFSSVQVRCTYDTSSKNITFGMMPIRDPDMISITSAPEAPAPRYAEPEFLNF
jgi:hypothetical protein